MADPTHPSDEEPSLRVSVLKNLAGAVGVVVALAVVFGLIGRADTPTPIAAERPDAEEATEAPSEPEEPEEPEEATEPADEDEAPEPVAPEPDPATEDEADESQDAAEEEADEAEPADEADEAPEPDPEPTPEETEDPTPSLPAGDISIQVLDGYKADGGAAARGVAATLRDDGYRIVAENQALSYDRTAVLWTAGNEAAARQVAARIGAAEVRAQPGNLSTAVDVHVVVGADRG
jgi:outer membrane biosynthesis protein TonB